MVLRWCQELPPTSTQLKKMGLPEKLLNPKLGHCVSHWESPGDTSRNLHFASKGKPGFVCMSAPLGFCFQNSLHSLLSQPHHRLISHLFFFLKKSFIHFRLKFFFISLLAAVGLWCCTQALSSWGEQGLLCVMGLLIVVASLVAGHRL